MFNSFELNGKVSILFGKFDGLLYLKSVGPAKLPKQGDNNSRIIEAN